MQWRHIVIFFDVALFLLSSLVTGPSFMTISSLVLELWKFSFYTHLWVLLNIWRLIQFCCSWNFATYYKVYLKLISKVKVKIHSECHNENTASKHQTCLKVYQEFRKIRKVENRVYLMNFILIKLRMCSNFAGISQYYLWYLVTC